MHLPLLVERHLWRIDFPSSTINAIKDDEPMIQGSRPNSSLKHAKRSPHIPVSLLEVARAIVVELLAKRT
eukprot:CAMPEP_0169112736 /NCGR_PEP_ID=MMETSP1015-20121227/27801_1 /TAXON_ID=342587 /ORGANISM="Karlodinium micrum, Strain CCMP2283" /LENGTH=69 /DNA_ID=CAMNT_0009174807 /DNA_START=317 /DNA_END=526 /DNA_ORIENTATION=-